MAMAPDQTPASSPGDFGEKVSISQLILSRLDDIRHDQDIIRQDLNTLRQDTKQDLNAVRQEISALRYWSWGSIIAVLVATVTIILSLKP
jgi:hypothetical protein